MREISVKTVQKAVKDLCIETNKALPSDLSCRIADCADCEKNPLAKQILNDLTANLQAAKELDVPICQDTGMAVLFIEVGQEIHFVDGGLTEAVNAGVHDGYLEGRLRCSVVSDPLRRVNTNDNTPAVIHYDIVPGDRLTITAAPKGFGSENMSSTRMFTPAASREDIIEYVVQTVKDAGSNPCPPVVVGVGIGGDFELCALLAKKALCRAVSKRNADEYYAQMEADLFTRINALGVGPQGFGGDTTALAVNIESYPTHIAGLPCAVNIGCHVTRHKSVII